MLNEKDKEFIIKEVSEIVVKQLKPTKYIIWSRTWFNWLTPPLMLGALIWIIKFQSDFKASQLTPQERITILAKMENLPDALVLKEIGTHVTDKDRHMSLQAKDSTYVRNIQYQIDKYNSLRKEESLIESVEELKVLTRLVFKKIDDIEAKK